MYELGSSKMYLNYCLVRSSPCKFLKDVKVLPSEATFTQVKPLVSNVKTRKVKDTKRKFLPRRKIKQPHEDNVKSGFKSYINNKYREIGSKDTSVESYWSVAREALLEATDRNCRWAKGPVDMKKHVGGITMLVMVLARSLN